jgi:hypothetical protein
MSNATFFMEDLMFKAGINTNYVEGNMITTNNDIRRQHLMIRETLVKASTRH